MIILDESIRSNLTNFLKGYDRYIRTLLFIGTYPQRTPNNKLVFVVHIHGQINVHHANKYTVHCAQRWT